ncbi:MAG: hypothetical protein HC871_17390, partial [Rhizobiales bacterium]|nr:hypothetical protein [Hyphomicrobiales bacterium]
NFDLKPKASLAESWDIAPDGKTVTFKLRKDVKFHDGKPFTSADVQFTIMDVLKKVHPRGINTFRDVTAIETPDAHTAVFKLANAAPYMLSALSGYESPMLPKHVFSQGDIRTHANANQPIGSGPFKFVEWRRGELVRLVLDPVIQVEIRNLLDQQAGIGKARIGVLRHRGRDREAAFQQALQPARRQIRGRDDRLALADEQAKAEIGTFRALDLLQLAEALGHAQSLALHQHGIGCVRPRLPRLVEQIAQQTWTVQAHSPFLQIGCPNPGRP